MLLYVDSKHNMIFRIDTKGGWYQYQSFGAGPIVLFGSPDINFVEFFIRFIEIVFLHVVDSYDNCVTIAHMHNT